MTSEPSAERALPPFSITPEADASPALALKRSLEALRDRSKVELTALKALQKAVLGLLGKSGFDDLRAFETHLGSLAKLDLAGADLSRQRDALIDGLTMYLQRRRAAVRATLMGDLQRAAVSEELELVRIGDSPPVLFLAPISVALDFEAGKASLTYAREEVAQSGLEAGAILQARRQAMQTIREQAVSSEAFFDHLRCAYGMVLAARGIAFGERVDLVDLLAPLALLRRGVERWRRADLSKLPPYPRYQLAYQLRRLRRDGVLDKGGWRLDLGTATGGTTRQKRNVLFVPQSGPEGQYYLSLRLVKSA